MVYVFCVDKENGLMFGSRRQSSDSCLRQKLLEFASGRRLWMSEYSAKQFESTEGISIDNDFSLKASADDICFFEDTEPDFSGCDGIVLFKWNRDYPADKFLEIDIKQLGLKKKSKEDFAGSSHKKITMEVYGR